MQRFFTTEPKTAHQMNRRLILPLISLFLLLLPGALSAQADYDRGATELRYAYSKNLSVYEKPDTSSGIVGQLIYDEAVIVVTSSAKRENGGIWYRIISPYEGYYFQTLKNSEAGPGGTPPTQKDSDESFFSRYRQKDSETGFKQDKKTTETGSEISEKKESIEAESYESTGTERVVSTGRPEWAVGVREKILIGFGISLFTVPEEKGNSTSGFPMDIHLEFTGRKDLLSKLRFGFNMVKASDGDYATDTKSLYAVYRNKSDRLRIDNVSVFGFAGVALMMSSVSGDSSGSSTGLGLVAGAGGYYNYSAEMKIGGQAIYFTNQADYGNVKRYIGSTQLLLTGVYLF